MGLLHGKSIPLTGETDSRLVKTYCCFNHRLLPRPGWGLVGAAAWDRGSSHQSSSVLHHFVPVRLELHRFSLLHRGKTGTTLRGTSIKVSHYSCLARQTHQLYTGKVLVSASHLFIPALLNRRRKTELTALSCFFPLFSFHLWTQTNCLHVQSTILCLIIDWTKKVLLCDLSSVFMCFMCVCMHTPACSHLNGLLAYKKWALLQAKLEDLLP